MELNQFVENFAAQFDDTDASVFTPATNFRELDEWSSLIALSIIAMVDEEYDVTLKGDDIRRAATIEDLFNTVKQTLNQGNRWCRTREYDTLIQIDNQ